jgi:hypothetical protein
VEASVSLRRIRTFLLCDEYRPIGEFPLHENGVRLTSITAAYSSKQISNESMGTFGRKELDDLQIQLSLLQSQLDETEFEIEAIRCKNESKPFQAQDTATATPLCLRRVTFECKRGEFVAVGKHCFEIL